MSDGRKRDRLRRFASQLLDRAARQGSKGTREVRQVRIEFEGHAPREVSTGQSLLQAAIRMGVTLPHYCGGHCSCGSCVIVVRSGAENLSTIRGREEMVLGPGPTKRGRRLACQSIIHGPVTVSIPEYFLGDT